MRYRLHLAILGLILTAFIANDVAAQRGGFGRGGGRGLNSAMMERMRAVSTFPVDRIWHVLSIRMETTDEQVLQLRAVVKDASSQKASLVEHAKKNEDWNWLREQLEANEKQFKENLKGMLSTDEIKTFEKLVEEASSLMPDRQGRSRR
ncbi:MAG: hypothetical protein F4014_10280 [Gemmatimonadetes bacterium]|nr:hypothetical protein [Gemmatimonadota bacterium]